MLSSFGRPVHVGGGGIVWFLGSELRQISIASDLVQGSDVDSRTVLEGQVSDPCLEVAQFGLIVTLFSP